MATDAAECQVCEDDSDVDVLQGKKCPHRGMAEPGALCQAGFYCPVGSITDTEYGCPAGSACPRGSRTHTPCADGYYQPFELQAACLRCPAGRQCPGPGATKAKVCEAGYYCPEGTGEVMRECPAGYESPIEGLISEDQCPKCTFGKYCENPAQETYTSACEAGYWCDDVETTGTPEGHKCLPG